MQPYTKYYKEDLLSLSFRNLVYLEMVLLPLLQGDIQTATA